MIELLIALAFALAAFVIARLALGAVEKQRTQFTRHAGAKPADLFVFLDPKQMWWMAILFYRTV